MLQTTVWIEAARHHSGDKMEGERKIVTDRPEDNVDAG